MSKHFTEISAKEINSTIGGSFVGGVVAGVVGNIIYGILFPQKTNIYKPLKKNR